MEWICFAVADCKKTTGAANQLSASRQEVSCLLSNVLVHTCCGPCASGTVPALLEGGMHPVLYWYNPNIHPFTEYASRLDSLRKFAAAEHLPLVIGGAYGLRPFVAATAADPDRRCLTCYKMRLDAAAEHAAREGYDAFTTTLLVSPYQHRDGILAAGREAAERFCTVFLEEDFRTGFRAGQEEARARGLYMQKYCGCIYSEEDRYRKRAQKIPAGFHPNFPRAAKN